MFRHALTAALLSLASASALAGDASLSAVIAGQGNQALKDIRAELRVQVDQDLAGGADRLLEDLRAELIAALPEQMRRLAAPVLVVARHHAHRGVMALDEPAAASVNALQ